MTGRANAAFIDLLFLLLIVFVLLPHKPETEADAKPPGNVLVEADWPDGWLVDVDLWVQAPGDVPVGYSNLGGEIFNLLRDDLGAAGDITERNREFAYARGAPDGEYIVNLHYFRGDGEHREVPVKVSISVTQDDGPVKPVYSTDVVLQHRGQEMTVVRFRLEDGEFQDDSISTLPKQLRSSGVTR